MKSKKSLMLISFAFIFLLTLSVVSAGFFDWLTGDNVRGSDPVELPTRGSDPVELPTRVSSTETTLRTGEFLQTSSGSGLQITEINKGKVMAAVTTNGKTQTSTLIEGLNVLPNGENVYVNEINTGPFIIDEVIFAPVLLTTIPSPGLTADGAECLPLELAGGATEVAGEITEFSLLDGLGFVNEHSIQAIEAGNDIYEITIDGMFMPGVLAGETYAMPIPDFCFYWEVVVAFDGTATFEVKETGLCGVTLEGT